MSGGDNSHPLRASPHEPSQSAPQTGGNRSAPFLGQQSTDAIEGVPDEIGQENRGGDLDGEVQRIGDVDKGIDTGGAGKERRTKANGAEHRDPGRDAHPNELCADKGNGKHCQISETIEDIGRIVEDREGLGGPDAGGGKNQQRGDNNGSDEDGVGWGAVARVKT